MRSCDLLSQRMPAVLAGADRWSAEDEHHLGECLDCAAEWRLVQAAHRIGASASVAATGPLATAVLAQVRAAKIAARRRRRAMALGSLAGLAAAAALALSVATRQPGAPATATREVALAIPLVELDDATDGELLAVLAEFEPAISDGGGAAVAGVEVLDDVDMERALRAWEES